MIIQKLMIIFLCSAIKHLENLTRSNESFESSSQMEAGSLWGTYRSNLYFGMRTKTPQALLTGIMWYLDNSLNGLKKIRHSCEIDDGIHFGWDEHDGRDYGHEIIIDKENSLQPEATFTRTCIKNFSGTSKVNVLHLKFGNPLESWGVKIEGKFAEDRRRKNLISFVYYVGYDGEDGEKIKFLKTKDYTFIYGKTNQIGNYVFAIKASNGEISWHCKSIPASKVWMFETMIDEKLERNLRFDSCEEDPNLVAIQLQADSDFEIKVLYFSRAGLLIPLNKRFVEIANSTSRMFQGNLRDKMELFDRRVDSVFSNGQHYKNFMKYALSNVLGGISYFYGSSYIYKKNLVAELIPPYELFTDVPARANFPRGFFWDSGFHNILIAKWDVNMSLEILENWIGKINKNGWVGREQVLGDEARSKVPHPYQIQDPKLTNPPSLLIPILYIAEMVKDVSIDRGKQIKSRLSKSYPSLRQHFKYLITSQRGKVHPKLRKKLTGGEHNFIFRWRGRSDYHTLTSGLDDYPRGESPSKYELHVDLLCWVGFFSKAMLELSKILEIKRDSVIFEKFYTLALRRLEHIHWDERGQKYSDLTTLPDNQRDLVFVPNEGYVNLYPLLFGFVDKNSPRLKSILDLIEDPNRLWTDYGIRSLSVSDDFYRKGDQYWTGPIWININYLILSSLKKNYMNPKQCIHADQATSIYDRLRMNLIGNMHAEYNRTGYIWEQYDDQTGKGQRSRPFTGWSALITLIITESYH